KLEVPGKFQVVVSGNGRGYPGSEAALQQLLSGIGVETEIPPPPDKQLEDRRVDFDPDTRMHNQFSELLDHTDKLIKESDEQREKFWGKADRSSVQQWKESTEFYKRYFWEE